MVTPSGARQLFDGFFERPEQQIGGGMHLMLDQHLAQGHGQPEELLLNLLIQLL